MDNAIVIQQTLRNYEEANDALLAVWDELDPGLLDSILEKQQNRLEQIANRMYHDEKEDNEWELIENTLVRYDWANEYLFEHWDSLPNDERLSIMKKQWQRLEELRKRNKDYH